MSDTDTNALRRWATHRDAEAFKDIAARHGAMVYAVCRRILGNATEAEDAAQECFESLATTRDLSGVRSLGAWLHGAAVKLALQRIRAGHRRAAREATYAAQLPPATEPKWDDIHRFVDEAIAELPQKLRDPVVAHFLEDHTHAEIAQSLGVSRQTVTYRIAKGIELVRKNLRRKGVPVQVTAIAAVLTATRAEAIPAALSAALGRVAMSGVGATGQVAGPAWLTTFLAITGGFLMTKKTALIVGVAVLFVVGTLSAWRFAYAPIQDSAPSPPAIAPARLAPVGKRTAPELRQAVATSTPAVATSPASSERVPGTKGALVDGKLVDIAGQPLAGWEVTAGRLGDNGSFAQYFHSTELTSADGAFAISGLAPGLYRLYALVQGDRTFNAHSQQTRISLTANEQKKGIVLVFDEGLTISSRVVDTEGRPVPRCKVMCEWRDEDANAEDEPGYEPGYRPTADLTASDGAFRLVALLDTSYSLRIVADGFEPLYWHDIPAGAHNLSPVLKPSRVRIRGRVISKLTGAPIEEFSVGDTSFARETWELYFAQGVFTPVHNPDGRFEHDMDTMGGAATLLVQAKGYQPTVKPFVDLPSGSVVDLVVALEGGRRLKVRVVDSKGAAVAGVYIFSGVPPNPARPSFARSALGQTDGKGVLEITTLASRDTIVSAAAHGRVPALAAIPNLDTPGASVDIRLPDHGGTVEGTVMSEGKPLRNAELQLLPSDEHGPDCIYTTRTDGSGHFHLTDLPECAMNLACVTERTDPADGAVTQLWTRRSLNAHSGQELSMDFDTSPGDASLEGRVTVDGAPIAVTNVFVVFDGGSEGSREYVAQRHNNGAFVLHGLPAGAAELHALFPLGECEEVIRPATLQRGRTTRQDIEIKR